MIKVAELNTLAPRECISALWGDSAPEVLEVIDTTNAPTMSGNEFLNHCTPCGGNWCALLLTGIKALYPEVYETIPDDMGKHAFYALGTVLELLNINF